MKKIQTTEFQRKLQLLDSFILKLMAMIAMAVDHIGVIFFPEADWMHIIGRLSMPIFAFCIAEGFSHTHSRKSYLLRMGCFALISELPFDIVFYGHLYWKHQT